MPDPDEVISKASLEKDAIQDNIREVADWFHDNEGDMFKRDDVIDTLSEQVNIECPDHIELETFTNKLMSSLVGDHVDPVQQISNMQGKYVGVIQYDEHDGFYTFKEYHDIEGEYVRGVCAGCVHQSTKSSEPFTRHTGNFGNEPIDGSIGELCEVMKTHVDTVHEDVENIETGATLASGTTISSNTAYHAGNDGVGSGLSADDVDGSEPPFANSDLSNSLVTVANNSVSLGGSTNVNYVDLNDTGNSFPIPNSDLINSSITVNGSAVSLGGSVSVSGYTDSDAISAINNDTGHGSTASHNYYTDSEAVSAVNAQNFLSVNISGDSDTVDGWDKADIQNWVNNNADVPNADYADNAGFATNAGDADTVDGQDASTFTQIPQSANNISSKSGTVDDSGNTINFTQPVAILEGTSELFTSADHTIVYHFNDGSSISIGVGESNFRYSNFHGVTQIEELTSDSNWTANYNIYYYEL